MQLKGKHIAFCYIYQVGDEKNKCLLTDEYFYVIKNKKRFGFALADVNNIALRHKKLLAPLVTGGVLGPLSLLAVFKGMFNPWYALTLLFLGAFLFYYGWVGTMCITVLSKLKEYNFFVRTVSQNLSAFINFANDYLPLTGSVQGRYFYMISNKDNEDIMESLPGDFVNKDGRTMLYTFAQLQKKLQLSARDQFRVWVIDPFKEGIEINFEKAPDSDQLHPFVYGHIPAEAIVKDEAVIVFDEGINPAD